MRVTDVEILDGVNVIWSSARLGHAVSARDLTRDDAAVLYSLLRDSCAPILEIVEQCCFPDLQKSTRRRVILLFQLENFSD